MKKSDFNKSIKKAKGDPKRLENDWKKYGHRHDGRKWDELIEMKEEAVDVLQQIFDCNPPNSVSSYWESLLQVVDLRDSEILSGAKFRGSPCTKVQSRFNCELGTISKKDARDLAEALRLFLKE